MNQTTTRGTGIALAVIGALLLANGAWYFPLMMSDPSALMSEYGGEWPFRTFYTVQVAAVVALAVLIPRLGGLTGRTGRRLPGWLVLALQVVAIGQVATLYAQAFVVPHLARVAPAALDNQEIDAFAISMISIWIAWSLLLVVLAVIGAMRRVVPVGAAVPMALGALATPVLGPGGWALVGAALLVWSTTRILRATSAVDPAVGLTVGAAAA